MPIYMIMPRYSHNYALFHQLLDSNLFTHRNTYAILREATSETYGPRVYLWPPGLFSIILIFRQQAISVVFYLCIIYFAFILLCIILFSRQLAISVAVYFAIFTFQSIQQKYQKYLSYYLY